MISDWYHPDALLSKYFTRNATYMTKPWEISWMLWKIAQTPGNILEIGTHYGETTREFALAFPDRKIYAVDCPVNLTLPIPQRNEIPVASKVCEAARDLPNVQLIIQDSRTLGYRMLDDIGFVFIDGDHSYDGVAADSEKAFAHFASRSGVVVWHDCFPHEYIAVHAYLTSRSQKWPGRFKTVIGTSLAFAEFPPALT